MCLACIVVSLQMLMKSKGSRHHYRVPPAQNYEECRPDMGQMMGKTIQATWPCSVDIASVTICKNNKNKKIIQKPIAVFVYMRC